MYVIGGEGGKEGGRSGTALNLRNLISHGLTFDNRTWVLA